MKKNVLGMLAILFFVILTTSAFAQTTAPSDEGTRPGPGMMYSQSQAPGPGQGQEQRQGQGQDGYGPGMMGGQRQGQGQGTYGPGMMYGYGAGWMGGYGGIWLTILVVLLIGGLVAWGVKQRRHGNRT